MSTFPFKKAAFAVAAVAALLLTGCFAPSASDSSPTSAPASATASPSATETVAPVASVPASTDGATPYMASAAGSYQDRLSVGSSFIKSGESLHVYGGTLEPGTTVKIYAAQQMAPPSYDAANKMYVQVGEEVKVTETVEATVNAKGVYDVQLLIPAGTPAQLLNIVMLSSDGRGDLVRTTVQ